MTNRSCPPTASVLLTIAASAGCFAPDVAVDEISRANQTEAPPGSEEACKAAVRLDLIEAVLAHATHCKEPTGPCRYTPGGGSPAAGFDCSGFTQWFYQQYADFTLPPNSDDQMKASVGARVARSELQPGDLVFFSGTANNGGATHVAILVPKADPNVSTAVYRLAHSRSPGEGVGVDDFTGYWIQHFYGAVRPNIACPKCPCARDFKDVSMESNVCNYRNEPGFGDQEGNPQPYSRAGCIGWQAGGACRKEKMEEKDWVAGLEEHRSPNVCGTLSATTTSCPCIPKKGFTGDNYCMYEPAGAFPQCPGWGEKGTPEGYCHEGERDKPWGPNGETGWMLGARDWKNAGCWEIACPCAPPGFTGDNYCDYPPGEFPHCPGWGEKSTSKGYCHDGEQDKPWGPNGEDGWTLGWKAWHDACEPPPPVQSP